MTTNSKPEKYKGMQLRELLDKFVFHSLQYKSPVIQCLGDSPKHYAEMEAIALELANRMEQGQRYQERQAELTMIVTGLEKRCHSLEESIKQFRERGV